MISESPSSSSSSDRIVIPSIVQSTRGKSTISSLLLSTFSSENEAQNQQQQEQGSNSNNNASMSLKMMKTKKKNSFASSTLRGLGCSAGSSQQVSVPAVIRSSADWEAKARKRKPRKSPSSSKNNNNGGGKDRNALILDGNCGDFQDVWCGPGIESVDCVVAARVRNVGNGSRGKIDSANRDRERSCIARRTVLPEPPLFFDTESEFLSERLGSDVFGGRYFRHVRHPSSEGFAEIMMLQGGLIMGGRVDIHDRYRDMRLDVDNMSYEELLDLGERIGYVSTGLKEDEIRRCIRKIKHSVSNEWSRMSTQADRKCSICQEEYEGNEDIGKLDCGHGFHMECIFQWLAHKNTCPVCKSEAVARPR